MSYKEYKIMGILGMKCYNSIKEKYFDMKRLSDLNINEVTDIYDELHRRDDVVPNCDKCTIV
tara:strand:+ start:104 stop:289 length:186 start_codon:yes stop_codon:yes gene_type:complete